MRCVMSLNGSAYGEWQVVFLLFLFFVFCAFVPVQSIEFAVSGAWNVHPFFRPQIKRDYPLNLSISVSGGKENKSDSLSNGE